MASSRSRVSSGPRVALWPPIAVVPHRQQGRVFLGPLYVFRCCRKAYSLYPPFDGRREETSLVEHFLYRRVCSSTGRFRRRGDKRREVVPCTACAHAAEQRPAAEVASMRVHGLLYVVWAIYPAVLFWVRVGMVTWAPSPLTSLE